MIQNAVYDVVNGIWYKSDHVHDYVSIPVGNGWTFIDGGTEYRRTSMNFSKLEGFEEWSLYESSPYDQVKKRLLWGTYGISGKDPLRWVPLCHCSNDHLNAILNTQSHISPLYRTIINEILRDRIYG